MDGRGRVRHVRGVTDSKGLYMLGMTWQHTRTSALLGWVGDDAAFLADRIEVEVLGDREGGDLLHPALPPRRPFARRRPMTSA